MSDFVERDTVLIVDDEEFVLSSIEAFLSLKSDYCIKSFTCPKKALEYVKVNNVNIVISDFLMPEMNGLEFLSEVKDIKPDIPRIILTGYADKENAIKAINEVGLYQYIQKPWDNDVLYLIIRNGIEKQKLMSKLKKKVSEISDAYSELKELNNAVLKTFV